MRIPTYTGQQTFTSDAAGVRSLAGERETPQDYSGLKRAEMVAYDKLSNIGDQVTQIGVKMQAAEEKAELTAMMIDSAKEHQAYEQMINTPEYRGKFKPTEYSDQWKLGQKGISDKLYSKYKGASSKNIKQLGFILEKDGMGTQNNVFTASTRDAADRNLAGVMKNLEVIKNDAATAAAQGDTKWYVKYLGMAKGMLEANKEELGEAKVESLKQAFTNDLNKDIWDNGVAAAVEEPNFTGIKKLEGMKKMLEKKSFGFSSADREIKLTDLTKKIEGLKELKRKSDDHTAAQDWVQGERQRKVAGRSWNKKYFSAESQEEKGKVIKDMLSATGENEANEATVRALLNEYQSGGALNPNPSVQKDIIDGIASGRNMSEENDKAFEALQISSSQYSSNGEKQNNRDYKNAMREIKAEFGITETASTVLQMNGKSDEVKKRKLIESRAQASFDAKIDNGQSIQDAKEETLYEYREHYKKVTIGEELKTRNLSKKIETWKLPDQDYLKGDISKKSIMDALKKLTKDIKRTERHTVKTALTRKNGQKAEK